MSDQNSKPPILLGDTPPENTSFQPVVPPMPSYQYGNPPSNPTGYAQNPQSSIGMVYNPVVPQGPRMAAPPSGLRFLRGAGWGALFGQWWTLWTIASHLLWHGTDGSFSVGGLALLIVIYAVVYAFFGAIAGLIIAAISAPPGKGALVGIVVGLCVMGIEAMIMGGLGSLINIFFYYVTGRYIGVNIAVRVSRPVQI